MPTIFDELAILNPGYKPKKTASAPETLLSYGGESLIRMSGVVTAKAKSGHKEDVKLLGSKIAWKQPSQFTGQFRVKAEEYLRNPNNTPKEKVATPTAGDLLLDATLRSGRTSRNHNASLPEGDLAEAFAAVSGSKTASDALAKKSLSDAEVTGHLKSLLNSGVSPKEAAARLAKLADAHVFDNSIASEYLKNNAGILGLAYIEPNAFMNDCVETNNRMDKQGGVKAKSVKQIAACNGCQYYKKTAAGKSCGVYGLPIIATKAELNGVIDSIVPGAKNKQAVLIQIANGHSPIMPTHTARSTGEKGKPLALKARKKTAASFNEIDVLGLHNSGMSMKDIFAKGASMVGAAPAEKAIRSFIAGLKGSKTKIALAQLDCTLLKNKLGASNQIIGAAKCASCTYRNGMHCGLTGGTLISFPGMATAKTASSKLSADGTSLLKEFEMTPQPMNDISFVATRHDNIELNGFGSMDI